MFQLAGHLGMTVGELEERMTSAELSEWMALNMYHQPLPQSWHQTGIVAAAVIAPHAKRGQAPKPKDFIPTASLPQTADEMMAELSKLKTLTGG